MVVDLHFRADDRRCLGYDISHPSTRIYNQYKPVLHCIIWEILLSLQEDSQIPNIKQILLQGRSKKMPTRTDAIHVSDLIFCARKNCYSRRTTITPDLTKKKTEVKAHMLLGGELAHLKLDSLLGSEFKCEQEINYICRDGTRIVGHIDAVHISSNTCIEFKTTEVYRLWKTVILTTYSNYYTTWP